LSPYLLSSKKPVRASLELFYQEITNLDVA
jgi:hypothetical protein